MFDIHWLELDNFKSFKGRHRVDLPTAPGLYHITGFNEVEPRLGANGVGKSTLLDAIYWALYGKSLRGLRAGDVVSRGERGCAVTVSLTIGSQRLEIRRTQAPNALTLNGTPISPEALQKQLRLGPEAFTYSVILPQFGQAFFDLLPSAKLTLFSQIMELDYWLGKSAVASELVAEIDKAIALCSVESGRCEGVLQTIDGDIEGLAKRHEGFAQEQAASLKLMKAHLDEIRQCKSADAIAFSKKALLNIANKIERAEKLSKQCPTCGQPVRNKDLDELLVNKAEFERQLTRQERDGAVLASREASLLASLTKEQKRQSPYADQIKSKQEKKKAAQRRLKQLQSEVDQLQSDHASADYWVGGFKRIRLLLVEQTLRQLELEVNNNVASLGLTDWQIKFDVERENKTGGVTKGFTVLIFAPGQTEPTRFEAWSGGETQRLRLAGDLGLANLIMERAGLTNTIEMYDEPSAHLSQEGLLDLAETLHQRALSAGKRIFLVDHNALDFGAFSGRFFITKRARGSELVLR